MNNFKQYFLLVSTVLMKYLRDSPSPGELSALAKIMYNR